MKPIRILSVTFDTEIAAHETPAFRGAVIEKVGLEHELFHNHNNDPQARVAYHYRYPLVQHKRWRRKPSIVFIDKGVDQAQHFFMQPDWRLDFAGRRFRPFEEVGVLTFDLRFKVNVLLPGRLGWGGGVSRGLGWWRSGI